MLAITNATVWTMAGPRLDKGRVLVEDGRIVSVGSGLDIPADADIIDAAGMVVTPGLIDAHSHLGLWESCNGFEGADGNEKTDPVTPHMRGTDAFNPLDVTVGEALAAGVTCAAIGPGSANVIGGTFAVVKTHGTRVDRMVLRDPVAMKCAFGKNPKAVYDAKGKSPSTRMAIAAVFREAMFKAQRYLAKVEAADGDPDKLPDFDMKCEALLPVLRREIPIKAHAHRTDDLFTALRLAREFNLRITLDHVTEGALIAAELAAEGVPCIVGPSFGHRTKDELRHKSFETPGMLHAAGVEVAITTDSPVTPLASLPLMAGMAVKAGMPREAALEAITSIPAKILEVDNRVGTLEKGKDADIVIFDGDPLALGTHVKYVFVDGQNVAPTW
ncbi:MAG: amidohydrolase [Lentisphaeria bacterium]|nr:amidohydrolase [Lentisphaeria bacterium]